MSDSPMAQEVCDHFWAWVSPAGARSSARLCMLCHQPSAEWLNTIIEKGEDMELQVKARTLVMEYVNEHLEKTDNVTAGLDDIYVVWWAKTLQNWKAMVSTTLPDGMYYEVTHNGDTCETYLDAYKKFNNVVIPD